MKPKTIAIILLCVTSLTLLYFLKPIRDKPLLEYYEDLRLSESEELYHTFFDQAENAAWVLWADNGVIHYQESVYRVSCPQKLTFSEDTFLYVADGYKARLFGEDWVLGSEGKVMYIPAGTSNYINIGAEYDTEITVEEVKENVLFLTKKEVEKNLDNLLISKTDRTFLNEVLSYAQ